MKKIWNLEQRQQDTAGSEDSAHVLDATLSLLRGELALVEPPTACFEEGHARLWSVRYSGRVSPLVLPPVHLDPAWRAALEAIVPE